MNTANTTINHTSVVPDMRNFADLSDPRYPQNVNWQALETFVLGQKPDGKITQPVDERTTTAKQLITDLQGYYMYGLWPCEKFAREGMIAASRAVHKRLVKGDFDVELKFCRTVFAERLVEDEDARQVYEKYYRQQDALWNIPNRQETKANQLSDGENFFLGFRIGFEYSLYLLEKAEEGESLDDDVAQTYAVWLEEVPKCDQAEQIKLLQEFLAVRPIFSLF